MSDSLDALILDLLEWVGPSTRGYDEVLEAWRTSCPRLPVWEEVNSRGLLRRLYREGRPVVSVTALGARLLARHRPGNAVAPLDPRGAGA